MRTALAFGLAFLVCACSGSSPSPGDGGAPPPPPPPPNWLSGITGSSGALINTSDGRAFYSAQSGVSVDLHGPALASYAVLASAAATPVPTPFGSLWLDPASTVVVASGTLGSARGGTHFLALPSMFPGSEFVMQAVVLRPSAVELSSPSVVVTR